MQRYSLAAVTAVIAIGLIAGCSSGPSEEELFTQAKKAQEARDFYGAVDAYKQVVSNYPNGDRADEAQFMVGFLYANDIRDVEKAKDAYETFLEKYSATSDSGMVLSAKWELANLGKEIEDIEEVMKFAREAQGETETTDEQEAGGGE
ncbi:MAG: Outer membrane protein assembly factor BamD [Calditrichaeota bacterium]|nr:Outer membrane protein assembly factor BamD [Calditrichota bacterium]